MKQASSLGFREREEMAERKKIHEKAYAVARRFGEGGLISYTDSGNKFHEPTWTFERGGLRIFCHEGYFYHISAVITHKKVKVFDDCYLGGRLLRLYRYVPHRDWEDELDVLYELFKKEEAYHKCFGL